jgi:DnaK suppressor protein
MPQTGSIAMAMTSSSVVYSPGVYRPAAKRGPILPGPRTIRSMDEAALATIRATLTAERDRLRAEIGEAIVAPGQMTYGSQAAAASQVFAQQRDLALRDRADQQLELVEEALVRLDAGTFGTCVRCGKPIATERLEALPWAARCIDCQRAGRDRA